MIDSRNQLQSAQTDPLALGHQFEPYFGKYAIFIHKRRNITDGPERHKIKVFPEIGIGIILPESFPPQGAAEGNKKVEYNANGGEMFEGKSTIRAMRIDSSERLRKGIGELMMVQDDRVHAQLSCIGDRFMIGYAAIYGDDQTDPLGSQSLYRLPVKSITLRDTVRDIEGHPPMDLSQKLDKNGNGSDAVRIIIPVDDYLLLIVDGADKTIRRFFHILHQKRIVKVAKGRGEVPEGIIRIDDIATHENPGYDRAEAQFPDQQILNISVALPQTPAGDGQSCCRDSHFSV